MNARKLSDYYKAIADAEDALAACPKSQAEVEAGLAEPVDAAQAYRDAVVTARNIVLAGSGTKAELLGTISTEPTAVKGTLAADGMSAEDEAEVLARAAALRAAALALEIPVVEPVVKG